MQIENILGNTENVTLTTSDASVQVITDAPADGVVADGAGISGINTSVTVSVTSAVASALAALRSPQVALGLVGGAAVIGGGYYAYKHYKAKKAV